jgi:hypothetical protein
MSDFIWIDVGDGRSVYRRAPAEKGPRSDLPAPMLVRDQMDPTWHPSDGREYESKSQFRQVTKAKGGVEVGNDSQTPSLPADNSHAADVGKAVQMLKEGYKPQVGASATEGWTAPTGLD